MTNEKTLGPKIKQYLVDCGIKQTFLAQKLGLPDPAISDMLGGNRKINADEYYLICKALGVNMSYFYEEV